MIPGWAAISASLQALVRAHGLALITLVIFLEELGIPLPLPGDVMMLLGGIRVAEGRDALWKVLLVEEAATLAGATLLFLISRRWGRELVSRFGRFVHFGPDRLARAEVRLRRHGGVAVLLARLVPGLRIVTVVAAGVLNVPARTFVPALAVGGFVYLLAYTLLGLYLGPPVVAFLEHLALPASALLSLAGLAALVVALHALERQYPPVAPAAPPLARDALLAGLVAGLAALLATNGTLGLVGFVAQLVGQALPAKATHVPAELRLLYGWPLFLALAVALGWLAGRLPRPFRPRPLRLLVVAGLPFALTLALTDPLADAGQGDLSVAHGAILVSLAAVRWLAFGLALDRLLPLAVRLRRVSRTSA